MLQRGKKAVAGVTAVALAAGILVTGTLAWQSMDQTAPNEVEISANMGARLHDDFNGTNKDVYVENYTSAEEDGQPVFARVRLDEYMEYGTGAGLKTGEEGFEDKDVTVLNAEAEPTPSIDEKSTWTTRKPSDTAGDNPFCANVGWTMGGQKVYMPTFNKDSIDLTADINGTLEGLVPGDETQYDDYYSWSLWESKTADATYGGDVTANETHYGANTLNATVKTMEEWKAAGSVPGDYWVWDTDGWAYWANPIYPGQATGLLLDGIKMTPQMSAKIYYAINVVGQFISKDDTGEGDSTGFYAPGQEPSADAESLLERIGAVTASASVQTLDVAPTTGNATIIFPGNTMSFQASKDKAPLEEGNVAWMVSGNTLTGTSISEDGTLTVDSEEPYGSVLTVTAVEKPLAGEGTPATFGSYTVTVAMPSGGIYLLGGIEAADNMVTAPGSTGIQLSLGDHQAVGTITWQLVESGVKGSSITEEGILTVGTGTGSLTITVRDQGIPIAKTVWRVQEDNLSGIENIRRVVPGSRTKVTIDDVDWYVLVNDGNKALILGVDGETSKYMYSSSVTWEGSNLQSYLRDTVLPKLPTLRSKAVNTQLNTWNGTSYVKSNDSIFLLSEADVFGTRGSANENMTQGYTYVENKQGKVVLPDIEMRKYIYNRNNVPWWFRSAYNSGANARYNPEGGQVGYVTLGQYTSYLRPAMWISLN